jgi:membrane-associated phospholipid phosphatase
MAQEARREKGKTQERARNLWRCVALLCVMFVVSFGAAAQTPTASSPPVPLPTPQASPTPSLEKRFLKNILRDQKAIWTSPFRVRGDTLRWLLPFGATTATLLATDRRTGEEIRKFDDQLSTSRAVSRIASYTGGAAAVFYLVGRAKGNARARETGLLGGEALIDGMIVSLSIKAITRRPRPLSDGGRGRFFTGGNTFPSGHAISAWTFATVLAHEYHDNRYIKFGSYGVASLVSLSRYTGYRHFLSDIFVGSAIGYGIGRYVYNKHHDQSLDGSDAPSTLRSRLIPLVSPAYNGHARSYGLTLAWNF